MAEPQWLSKGLPHIWIPYAQLKTVPRPVAVASTEGVRIKLEDGRELIDGVASWWTAVHGYRHPALLQAAIDQLSQMPHVMLGGLAHEPAYRLAARLVEITPGDFERVFFAESGSVAVEVAMKIVVQYWRNLHGEARSKFVSFKGGYHGDTFATMSVCDPDEGMHALFAGALADQHVVDLPEDAASLAALNTILAKDKKIAAVMVEPLLQGAGGMRLHNVETLRRIRTLCDEHGVLLICDEIFTGFGRTGAMFACEKAGVTPDIMTLGKGLTGGVVPLAATLASRDIYQSFHDDDPDKALMHGPTFSGYATACAVANASIDLFESEPRLEQATSIATHLTSAFAPLKELEGVSDIRVIGAMGAVEMKDKFDVDEARQAFIDMGLFVRPLGRVMYLTPSLTISENDLSRLTEGVKKMAHRLSAP